MAVTRYARLCLFSLGQFLPMKLASRNHRLDTPLLADLEKGWRPYPLFSGRTASGVAMTCHASVLVAGHSPHPPHVHDEEEILLVLRGEAELVLPGLGVGEAGDRVRLKAGEFVYYPAGFPHTLAGASPEPVNYLMFKWRGERNGERGPMAYARFEAGAGNRAGRNAFVARRLFEGPTEYLARLHGHVSTLKAGAGYGEHSDDYDVAIVVLEGQVETRGDRLKAHDVIYYAAGEPHGMHNPGDGPARYLVLEFHGAASGRVGRIAKAMDRLRRLLPRRR